MQITIDASNIKAEGGGLIHLQNLVDFYVKNIENKIIIYSNKDTLNKLRHDKYIEKKEINKIIEKNLILKILWQIFYLSKKKLSKSNILIILGSIYFGNFRPYIVLCQNMLPFSIDQHIKYNFKNRIKLKIQSHLFINSFKRSSGVIFMSQSSLDIIKKNGFKTNFKNKVILHGHNKNFKFLKKYNEFSADNPMKLLYVSRYEPYKNHIKLIKIFNDLIDNGFNIKLYLIFSEININIDFSKYFSNKNNFKKLIIRNNLNQQELFNYYKNSDCFIFPSECESFGLPLIEAASCNLPIACHNYVVFKEILGEYADYFNINDNESVQNVIIKLYSNIAYLSSRSKKLNEEFKTYSWEDCVLKYHNFFIKINENEKTKSINNCS